MKNAASFHKRKPMIVPMVRGNQWLKFLDDSRWYFFRFWRKNLTNYARCGFCSDFFKIWRVLNIWAQIWKKNDYFSWSYGGLKIAILGQLTRDIFRANNA